MDKAVGWAPRTRATAPGTSSWCAMPCSGATSTAPSTTCTDEPEASLVTLKVVPLTTAAR